MTATVPIGVIFDMDGVLVDSAEPHLKSWQRLAIEEGTTVTRRQFAETFGRQNRDIVPILFGADASARLAELSDRKEALYRDLIRDNVPIVPGAVALIRALHADGARLGVGSSGPKANIDLVLGAMGVVDCMSAIVSADDVTRGKPDPQVFSLACERFGLPPERCLVIEDAPSGVAAANAAGAKSVAILMHHPATAFEDADLVVDRLADLSVHTLTAMIE